MKKLLALTLVCLTMISSLALAETVTEIKPTNIIPSPIDYRGYTGFKIFPKKEGKITLQAYHMKINNKDMFLYHVEYCIYEGMSGGCGAFSSNGWIEGKVSGQNWIIRDGSFNAVLGKKIGNLKTNSMHAILEIE